MMKQGKEAEYNYIRMGVIQSPRYMQYKQALSTARVVTVGGVFINTLRSHGLTALYSDALDWYHGIDLVVRDGSGKAITVDLATYHKPEYKANLLIVISVDDGVVEQKRNAELIIRKLGGSV